MISMIESIFKLTVCFLLLAEFTTGTELIEVDIDDDPPLNWPEDLSTSSQIVFRPLFVYKQKKAFQLEENRRKAELAIAVIKKEKEPINIPFTPYYYNPYPSYYYNHNYRPYYYNYYPYYSK